MMLADRDEHESKSKNASSSIAEAIIGDIRSGELAIGSVVPTERELCDRFDASRPTVREALAQLQMRGHISSSGAGTRPRISRPSLQAILTSAGDSIRDILGDAESGAHLEQMRQFIEAGAAREAAIRASNLQVITLNTKLEKNFNAIGTPQFAETDIAFHRALVSVLGNPIFLTLHDMFVSTMLAHRPPTSDPAKYDKIAYEEHRAIYQAVLDGDVVAATEVMDKHLARSYRARMAAPRTVIDHTLADKTL
ncbi:FCD domain-containing protein [Ahrensia sp. 13_GOM-1096m]|uniref:FCD domain-containing protein n=1 Tax=Ahrensia sp. 13_GOM-1096m TaxID=1380380 RepID=UPI00047A0A51|nr:FCD domain-containing protein [Ahrensia sp. 13_GOM-1096m]